MGDGIWMGFSVMREAIDGIDEDAKDALENLRGDPPNSLETGERS